MNDAIIYEFKCTGCNANYIGEKTVALKTVALTQELKNTPPKALLK